jgi:hypothetical protein
MTIAGTIIFAIALAAAVFLISTLVLPTDGVAIGATAAVAVVIAWSWFYIPLVTFQRS